MPFCPPVLRGSDEPVELASPDILLWEQFRNGSREALAQLYKKHVPALHKHGLGVCKDPDLVSDCIHELFSRLWVQRERISIAINVRLYLCKSLERIVVAQLLRSKRLSGFAATDDLAADSSEQLWIDDELRKQRLIEIRKCLQSLPKCQREAILLKFFNDLSYLEISEIMDLQVASVYNLVSKAIEQLRQKLEFPLAVAS